MTLPFIAHCDWSTSPHKRWMAEARPLVDGSYALDVPSTVGNTASLLGDLRFRAQKSPVLVGFDFPVGIPSAYAELAGISAFVPMLSEFGHGRWADFYHPATKSSEIALTRPFYPYAPGGTLKSHLAEALGVVSPAKLLRKCDNSSLTRRSACEIFWILGAKQVGRAAISGWRDVLELAIRKREIALWPFDGELSDLLLPERTVVAETYPAEVYGHIGIGAGFGKTDQQARAAQTDIILSWCRQHTVIPSKELIAAIQDGFGIGATGEDAFDAIIGALGMIEAVQEPTRFCAPADPVVRNVEGWILGMNPEPGASRETAGRNDRPNRRAHPGSPDSVPKSAVAAPGSHKHMCPACKSKEFVRWPWGWDAHAAHTCVGIEGDTPDERKRVYRDRYL